LDFDKIDLDVGGEYLSDIILPISDRIRTTLGLNFCSADLIVNGQNIERKEQVESDFNLYSQFDKSFLREIILKGSRYLF
jgi:hypothetical protein